MEQVALFFMTYIFVFILYRFFIIRKTKEKKQKKKRFIKFKKNKKTRKTKNTKPIEVSLLETKYNLDLEKIDYDKLLLIISLVSSLDITIIITLVLIFNSYVFKVLVGFILTFPVILVSYEFIGRYYKKKGMTKND